MEIKYIPEEILELLHEWQLADIRKKIKAPIVVITESDPIWNKVDGLLVASTHISTIDSVWLDASIHEILPGHGAAWLSAESSTAILINSEDLQSIRDGGVERLTIDSLFKEF